MSSLNPTASLAVPKLSAASVILAVRLLAPSAPKSAANTVKSTKPAPTCSAVRVTVLGALLGTLNAEPPSNNSNLSPTTAVEPVVGNVTRNVVVVLSDAFIRPSARSVLSNSATLGAAGAVVSTVKMLALLLPSLPAASLPRA